jgi:single-stranded-DNA-specific exonuclease
MKKWTVGRPDKNTVSALMLGCGVTSLAAAALAAKGYSSPDSVAEALNIDELSDPFLLKDMQEAADTINAAIDSGERICIYGDYDCDGGGCRRYLLYPRALRGIRSQYEGGG